ncbi:acid phosphatase type 7-like [Mercenaria mercenaria]|uniref:acid phosphatase type 7-like n=1 Tax=Mercenaria mercenaria TaxID=6596 RepID=UPI00234E786C|nr:acid phosphatase type 7-like [Mercenaria mercenaria]
MVVTWSTMNATQTTVAMIGPSISKKPPSVAVKGSSSKFVDPGTLHHTQFIHTVSFSGLKPGAAYVYKVGTTVENVWSEVFTFRAMQEGSDWSPHIALYGDFGFSNHQSLQRLMIDNNKGMYDAVFHVGDLAYDMDSDNGYIGDKFMNMIQPLSARLPYMTCPGNHENKYNFTHYKNRFTMPGDEDGKNMFYSFDIGPAHVISISTEYYFFLQFGLIQPFRQYYWLENDLKEANKPENRAKRPWIITMGHRPMYCSNSDRDDCTKEHSWVRDGVPVIDKFGLEEMFYENGVDLAVWAHEHSYERLWPLYKDKVRNGSLHQPYTNPGAPVHITTGSAGCQEDHDPFKGKVADWSAFRSDDYGYTRMKIFNSTHLYLEQVSDDKNGTVIDKIMIIKDKHGSYVKKG